MDDKIEKAFNVANYMATLSNQRRIILEEFNQQLIYYINGATFKVSPELISFTKTVLELAHTCDVVFVDSNNFPTIIEDVAEFFDNIVSIYFEAINAYSAKITAINSKRNVESIVEL